MRKVLKSLLAAGTAAAGSGLAALLLAAHPAPASAAPAVAPYVGVTGVRLGPPAAGPPSYVPSPGLTATEVDFTNGRTTLHGSIVRRADLDTSVRHPGVVLVHGSGAGPRVTLTQEAEAFANAGIVALIYDKRADYSKFHRDFPAMADDALAGVRALGSTPYVDPDKVGLWGFSEGGWIAPLAAARSTDVHFLITIGGSGHNPARTQAWHLGGRMNHSGVAAGTADALASRGIDVVTGLGLFGAAGHDPVPALNRVRQPVLALWGERDRLVPPRESAEVFRKQLALSPSVTIQVLPGASHGGRITTDGYDTPGGPTVAGYPDGQLTPGYAQLMTSWVMSVTSGHVPASSTSTLPGQSHDSGPVTPMRGPGFALFGLLLVALLSWPVAALARRLVGRRGAPFSARPARYLAGTGLAAAVGSALYLVYVVAGQGQPGGTLLGQPVPWLALRLLLVAAFVSAGLLVRAYLRGRPDLSGPQRLRVGLLCAGAALLVPYALSIGLLLP